MLWQIEGTKICILGSVHVADTPLNLNGKISRELDEAEILAFEANLDVRSDSKLGLYKADMRLSDNIDESLFNEAKALWSELNLQDHMLERNRPWSAAFYLLYTLLARNGFHHEQGVDRFVFDCGKRHGKPLFFLEAIDAGLNAYARSPHIEQEVFLSRVVRHTGEGVAEVASMVSAWKANRPLDLMPIVDRCFRLMPITYSAALTGRNRAWVPQILRLARTGKRAVVVVGALHMIGAGGLPAILADRGINCRFIDN